MDVVDPTQAPRVLCTSCGEVRVPITASFCPRCGAIFPGRTLIDAYEKEQG